MTLIKKNFFQQVIKKLANLQLAIYLLLVIGILIAIGTFIEQDQSLSFYKENYPELKPVLGFVNWKLIKFLQIDKIYTSYWFFSILIIFGATLLSCTFTTQLPSLKQFRLWRFIKDSKRLTQFSSKDSFVKTSTNNIVYQLNQDKYHIFRQGKNNYAYTGLLGRFAPIVVHFSILLLLLGSTIGSLQGFTAQQVIPRGEIFHIQNLIKSGNLSYVSQNFSWRVNDFWITYSKDLKVNQFYSDLSVLDHLGEEIKRKTIYVNEPLNYKGITLYQTDWNIIGIKIKLSEEKMVQVPLKKISKGNSNFWFASISLGEDDKDKLSLVINDLRGIISLYDNKGTFIKQTFLGETYSTNNQKISIKFCDFITSTGLQIKKDPGIKTVYLSFLLLMWSTYTSFISYSQIWGLEEDKLFLAGTSNRAVLYFQEEFRKIKYKIVLSKD